MQQNFAFMPLYLCNHGKLLWMQNLQTFNGGTIKAPLKPFKGPENGFPKTAWGAHQNPMKI